MEDLADLMAVIAVVEDDEIVRKAIGALIRSNGHVVREYDDAKIAIEARLLQAVHLIITDLAMPTRAEELICFVQQQKWEIPILVTSGNFAGQETALKNMGVQKTISKPFDFDEFIATVNGLL